MASTQRLIIAPKDRPRINIITVRQRLAVYDAINACVQLLAEKRTIGRFELLCSVQMLNRWLNER